MDYNKYKCETLPLIYKRNNPLLFGIKQTHFLFALYCIFYISFLCFGAVVFSLLESPIERNLVMQLQANRRQFLYKYPTIEAEDLEAFINEIILASNRGVLATRNATGEPNWSFGQALFFSSTVVTTIGYGHVTPLSREGKAFCIIYSIFGIPFTLILLSAFVERLLSPVRRLLQWMNDKMHDLCKPLNVRLMHLAIIATIIFIIFLLIPAAIFAFIEPEWDYFDSFYYCFISLTTIGLGDYIPGDAPNQRYRPLYKILTSAYLIIGITFIMLTLTIFYDIPELNMGIVFSSSNDKRKSLENDNDDDDRLKYTIIDGNNTDNTDDNN